MDEKNLKPNIESLDLIESGDDILVSPEALNDKDYNIKRPKT